VRYGALVGLLLLVVGGCASSGSPDGSADRSISDGVWGDGAPLDEAAPVDLACFTIAGAVCCSDCGSWCYVPFFCVAEGQSCQDVGLLYDYGSYTLICCPNHVAALTCNTDAGAVSDGGDSDGAVDAIASD
jgi:hypothetical protein